MSPLWLTITVDCMTGHYKFAVFYHMPLKEMSPPNVKYQICVKIHCESNDKN